MKVRTEFVSNSSSSSFVVMMLEDTFNKTLKKCDPYIQKVIKSMEYKKQKVSSLDVIIIGTHNDSGGGSDFDYLEVDYDEDKIPESLDEPGEKMRPNEAYNIFIDKLPKDDIGTYGMDW